MQTRALPLAFALVLRGLVLCASGQVSAPDAAGQKAMIARMRDLPSTMCPSWLRIRRLRHGHGDAHPNRDGAGVGHPVRTTSGDRPASSMLASGFDDGTKPSRPVKPRKPPNVIK
jgi:hypothetical protein